MTKLDIIAKRTAAFLWMAALLLASPIQAGEKVGTVIDLTGPMMVRKLDGSTRILAANSAVELGDALITSAQVEARLRLADDSDLILKKATRLQIADFAKDENDPNNNRAILVLSEGGVRYTPGLAGIRAKGNTVLRTPGGDIASNSATFIADYTPQPQQKGAAADGPALTYARLVRTSHSPLLLRVQNTPPAPSGLNPGLYVQVLDGAVTLSNQGGSQNFAAGQFGFTPSMPQPPVVVPKNPGMTFTPPPSFNSPVTPGQTSSGSKSNAVDCQVR